ncbi:MAG: hypothetical protein IPF48_00435 [Sphingomonadales bacterium]|jgi:hypothetical protein|nr:hypothetical protein [Sphingomonadales bacterium]MBK6491537.1 hypothetical protein [Sphingomonadales bacterium]MBK6719051.1 hypothetical protein [Sphingomonadales bacterium]MBK8272984.1 hypothetical protein [Sphingomonadales bacterium]MBK8860259.1 hypothetical protein [Sphingomonadales bacterium]
MNALSPTETVLFQRDELDDRFDTFLGRGDPADIRQARKALAKARTWSTHAVSNPQAHSDDALAVHYVILKVTSRWMFAHLDTGKIQDAVAVCRRLAVTTSCLDRLECGHG